MRLKRGGRDFARVGHVFCDWAVGRMKCRTLATGNTIALNMLKKKKKKRKEKTYGRMRRYSKERVSLETDRLSENQWPTHDINDDTGNWGRNWGRNKRSVGLSSSSEKLWNWILNIEFSCSRVLPIHSTGAIVPSVYAPPTFSRLHLRDWSCKVRGNELGFFVNYFLFFWEENRLKYLFLTTTQADREAYLFRRDDKHCQATFAWRRIRCQA